MGLAATYTVEPLLTQVYIRSACAAGEAVQASLRSEAFRTLLMQRIEFFDAHRWARWVVLGCVEGGGCIGRQGCLHITKDVAINLHTLPSLSFGRTLVAPLGLKIQPPYSLFLSSFLANPPPSSPNTIMNNNNDEGPLS